MNPSICNTLFSNSSAIKSLVQYNSENIIPCDCLGILKQLAYILPSAVYPAEISTTAETQETWNDCSRKTKIKIRLIDYIIYMKLVLVFILKVVLWFLTYLSNLRRWFFFSAFSKRRELQDHGRLSLTLQSAHVDPLGRSLLISPCRKCFPGAFSFHFIHFIFLFNYKAWDITNKQSQFTMQFAPA